MVNEGEDVMINSKNNIVSIFDAHVKALERLGGEGECLPLVVLRTREKFTIVVCRVSPISILPFLAAVMTLE